MTFDPLKLIRARVLFKQIAALCFNGFEPTQYQLELATEMFKTWAEQEQLVNEHLRRVAA